MEEIIYKPIGIIHTLFKGIKGTPNQPAAGKDVEGVIEIQPEYTEGLNDIEGFSHIILIYHFHLSVGYSLRIKPLSMIVSVVYLLQDHQNDQTP
jgi:tRNA (Thr-GGU) A37 N-methylase